MDSMRESRPAGASAASRGEGPEGARVVGARWAQISAGGWSRLECWVAALTRRGGSGEDEVQPDEPAGYLLAVADATRGIDGRVDAG
jgi:hypothetical protein